MGRLLVFLSLFLSLSTLSQAQLLPEFPETQALTLHHPQNQSLKQENEPKLLLPTQKSETTHGDLPETVNSHMDSHIRNFPAESDEVPLPVFSFPSHFPAKTLPSHHVRIYLPLGFRFRCHCYQAHHKRPHDFNRYPFRFLKSMPVVEHFPGISIDFRRSQEVPGDFKLKFEGDMQFPVGPKIEFPSERSQEVPDDLKQEFEGDVPFPVSPEMEFPGEKVWGRREEERGGLGMVDEEEWKKKTEKEGLRFHGHGNEEDREKKREKRGFRFHGDDDDEENEEPREKRAYRFLGSDEKEEDGEKKREKHETRQKELKEKREKHVKRANELIEKRGKHEKRANELKEKREKAGSRFHGRRDEEDSEKKSEKRRYRFHGNDDEDKDRKEKREKHMKGENRGVSPGNRGGRKGREEREKGGFRFHEKEEREGERQFSRNGFRESSSH
ncbi:hypothetical protein AMTRI_Chr01g108460 [Amborella trichopoda]|uniref:Uncharacterized protein n=1 Tax=Amborella trichopoda TaxID=13333 RepID=W1NY73_AMBTC|nr:hypothetical protein AMTR_s00107p00134310 [Amborella trichopoda]